MDIKLNSALGHEKYTIMSRWSGGLMGSQRVPWLGGRGLELYRANSIFLVWHARQWRELGEPGQILQAKKTSIVFSVLKIHLWATL